jgi:hypothetical protein
MITAHPNPDKPEIPMTKSQDPNNNNQIPMFKIPNLTGFGHWSFGH